MGIIYIPGSQPGAGKTALAVSLAQHLGERGKRVALFKPLVLVPDDRQPYVDADMPFYLKTIPHQPRISGEWPLTITQESLSAKVDSIVEKVREASSRLLQDRDTLIVEGLNSLDPASAEAKSSAKLGQALGARVLPVILHQPDFTPQQVLKTRDLFRDRLWGVVINGVLPFMSHLLHHRLIPEIESHGVGVLGTVPEDRTLAALMVKDVAEHLHGEIAYFPEKGEDLVEYFMVGGWTMDSGVHVFSRRERKAVIARTSRPDIQMAALATDPACMVLTGGGKPIQYVEQELKEREVPAVLVQQNTLAAMAELDTVSTKASVHHSMKIARFSELLKQRFHLTELLSP